MRPLTLVPPPRKSLFTDDTYTPEEGLFTALGAYRSGDPLPAGLREVEWNGDSSRGGEAYRLEITSDGIVLAASGDAGRFYALQTLRQLLRQADKGRIPCGALHDWPDFPVRGVLWDISRDRVPTMETLYMMVDLLAEWKYNQLQLYTEHTFAYSGHSEVWQGSSPLTPEEARALDRYCRERCIELVPNQNSFGHMERWLSHPAYHPLAESPEGFTDPWGHFRPDSSTLAPLVPESLDFLRGLYDQLLPCFQSSWLNVGGDEPWELGKGRSREICEREGLDRVYLDFLAKIHGVAAERRHRIQVYGDIIMKYPHLIPELPEDIVVVNWGYEANHPFEEECRQIARAGIPFYVCTGTSAWNSLAGRWDNARGNIEAGAESGLRHGAAGLLVSEWGDNGHWQPLSSALPGLLYGAALAWNRKDGAALAAEGETGLTGVETALALHPFRHDPAAAQALMTLQDVWACTGIPLHNASLPVLLLLDPVYPYYRDEYHRFRDYDFAAEEALIGRALDLLGQGGDPPENALFRREIRWTAALLKHACRLGRRQLRTPELRLDQVPAEERRELADELEELMAEYRAIWLLRSRPGGLAESLGRFEALLKSYRGGVIETAGK